MRANSLSRGAMRPESTRRSRSIFGTTLIEVLVVIVVFLVGILAVVQIFPKGLQILSNVRNSSVATALSRDEIERLKSRSEQLPEAILAAVPLEGDFSAVDPNRNPNDLGPTGDSLLPNGMLQLNGGTVGHWARYSGANGMRRIIGEGRRIPTARRVGTNLYGGLMILQFGPVEYDRFNFRVYGNDLVSQTGTPGETDDWDDYEYFVTDENSAQPTLLLPAGDATRNDPARQYRVSFSGYVADNNPTGFIKRDFVGLVTVVIPPASPDARGRIPLVPTNLQQLLFQNGLSETLGSVDISSLRVQRLFRELNVGDDFSTFDPYEFQLLDANLGILLFNPTGNTTYIPRGNGREALRGRVDYDVYDWRILREEFRFPIGLLPQHRLALGGIKVGTQTGVDGLPIGPMLPVEQAGTIGGDTGLQSADNFVLLDLDSGGVYYERQRGSGPTGAAVLRVDKNNGLITVVDQDPNAPGTQAWLRLTDGTDSLVNIDNRAVRALYMSRLEYGVQVLKAPSSYSVTYGEPGAMQYYVGRTSSLRGLNTRVYFPLSDLGRKVTIGEINYLDGAGNLKQMFGQDFVVLPPLPNDIGLPYIDITSADRTAVRFSDGTAGSPGYAVRDVKGASVAVRTVWNPDFFNLGPDSSQNMQRFERWGRSWRKAVTETFLEQGGTIR